MHEFSISGIILKSRILKLHIPLIENIVYNFKTSEGVMTEIKENFNMTIVITSLY